MLLNLGVHQEWRGKRKKGIENFISRHLGYSPFSTTRPEGLGAIPIPAWEDELSTVDACIQESLRLSMNVVTLRRNLHEDVRIDGKIVRQGDFFAYPMDEVHLNPEYPEPRKYDPGRLLEPDRGSDAIYPFLVWGVERHPCGDPTTFFAMPHVLPPRLALSEPPVIEISRRSCGKRATVSLLAGKI